jgi:ferric-dicitrate binding protein FerR (iron transport regulator)
MSRPTPPGPRRDRELRQAALWAAEDAAHEREMAEPDAEIAELDAEEAEQERQCEESERQSDLEHRDWLRRRDRNHTLAFGVVMAAFITAFGLFFWPLWLLAFPAGGWLNGELRKIRDGGYDHAHDHREDD